MRDVSACRLGVGGVVMSDVSAAQRDALYGWLTQLKTLAGQGDVPSRAMLADTELVRVLDTLETLLSEHEPNEDGRCPSCPARAQRRGYRCAVWVTVHRKLLAVDQDAAGGRHALSSHGRGFASW
jgi:hypothetical protein